jgi:hypothetical protein
MKLKWKAAKPAASPFEPDGPVYQVRSAELAKTANLSMRVALAAVVDEALRLAPANLDGTRSLVLFEWDVVYSTLTVVFTDARRNDAPDVLKLFCKGWDREHQKARNDWMTEGWMMSRAEAVRAWLDTAVVRTKPRWKKLSPKRAIRVAFKDKDKARVQTLGDGKFKDPYART